jgi:hypothetical protein
MGSTDGVQKRIVNGIPCQKGTGCFFLCAGGVTVTIIPILLSHNPHQMLVFRTRFLFGQTDYQRATDRAAVGEWFGGE